MSRKTARDVALKMLFSQMFGGEEAYRTVLEQSGMEAPFSSGDEKYAQAILAGVLQHASELDGLIEENAIGWALDRMPKVDFCILRIALFEMRYRDDIPHSVSINEAVELAKRYSGEKSPAFINGILGTVSRQLEKSSL